jgi:hypothetical protein
VRDCDDDSVGRLQPVESRPREPVFFLQEIPVCSGVVQLNGDAEILEFAHDVDAPRVVDVGNVLFEPDGPIS